jgi:hypothetical protein
MTPSKSNLHTIEKNMNMNGNLANETEEKNCHRGKVMRTSVENNLPASALELKFRAAR